MEALGMSLEEVFVAIVDQVGQQNQRYERSAKKAPARSRIENEVAKSLTEKKKKSEGSEYSALFDDDDE
jgi:hypothetical protein